jgi:hypothetical protein
MSDDDDDTSKEKADSEKGDKKSSLNTMRNILSAAKGKLLKEEGAPTVVVSRGCKSCSCCSCGHVSWRTVTNHSRGSIDEHNVNLARRDDTLCCTFVRSHQRVLSIEIGNHIGRIL